MNRPDLLEAMAKVIVESAAAAAVRDSEPKTDIQLQFEMMKLQVDFQHEQTQMQHEQMQMQLEQRDREMKMQVELQKELRDGELKAQMEHNQRARDESQRRHEEREVFGCEDQAIWASCPICAH